MLRTATKALLVPLALSLAGPAWAQNDQSDSQRQQDSNRQQNQQRQRDSQSSSQRQRSGNRQQSDNQQALTHYRAGLAAGYMLGYADGMDDYVLIVGTSSGDRAQSGSRQNQEQFRNQMRSRARREASARNQGQGQRSRQTANSSRQQKQQQQQRFSGEIRSLKRVRLRNDEQQHTVVLIRNDQDKRRIVDLGPSQQLQDLDLQKGDQITVQGRILRTRDGVPVVNARRVQSQGQSVAVRANGQQGQSQSRR